MKLSDAFASMLHEHYNIQGSAWNSAGSAWRFYVNCAISFPDVPVLRPGSGMWKYHAHTRLGLLVPSAPSEYDVTQQNQGAILTQLCSEIERCGTYFARRHQTLKDSYQAQHFDIGFPYDPELKRG